MPVLTHAPKATFTSSKSSAQPPASARHDFAGTMITKHATTTVRFTMAANRLSWKDSDVRDHEQLQRERRSVASGRP
jgi:hypothetical protein